MSYDKIMWMQFDRYLPNKKIDHKNFSSIILIVYDTFLSLMPWCAIKKKSFSSFSDVKQRRTLDKLLSMTQIFEKIEKFRKRDSCDSS